MIDDVQRLQQPPTESTLPGHYGEHIIEMNYYAGDIFRLRFGGYGVPQTWKRILGYTMDIEMEWIYSGNWIGQIGFNFHSYQQWSNMNT